MTWDPPRRDLVLKDVIAEADRRLDGELPMDVPGVEHTFRDASTLAGALHVRWSATLATHVERELVEQPEDPESAVVRAWWGAARELPGVRMVLDRLPEQAQGGELARLHRREARQRQWLAHRAGLSSNPRTLDDDAVLRGEQLELAGRSYFDPRARKSGRSLVERIKAALTS
jgi:hypothetical protein